MSLSLSLSLYGRLQFFGGNIDLIRVAESEGATPTLTPRNPVTPTPTPRIPVTPTLGRLLKVIIPFDRVKTNLSSTPTTPKISDSDCDLIFY